MGLIQRVSVDTPRVALKPPIHFGRPLGPQSMVIVNHRKNRRNPLVSLLTGVNFERRYLIELRSAAVSPKSLLPRRDLEAYRRSTPSGHSQRT